MTSNIRRLARPSCAALRVAPFTLALLAAASAQAQNGNQLDPVLVTATRSPLALSQVLADVTVLTRADIERQAYAGVADLLRSQPGFELVRNGGPGANTSLFVRGADTRHTVVLIDGVRVDSQASSGASWQDLPLAQIERIEIVRGAASAIYGSDAIGGVVQIFTRKGDGKKPQLEVGLGAGNRGLAKGDASLSGKSGLFDYALAGAIERSDGFNIYATPSYNQDRDGYRNHSYSLRLGAQLAGGQRLELTRMGSHVNSQYDGSLAKDDHSIYDATVTGLNWRAQWDPRLNTQLSVGESTDRYETRPSAYLTDTRVRSYAFSAGYQLATGHQLNAVLERREDALENSSLSSSPTPGSGDRFQNAVGLGYLWSAGPASLQLHARRDDDSQFGGASTGSIAAGYQFTPQWRLLTSYGSAFRAPSLYQLYSVYGVASLQPERSRNTEIAVHYKQGVTGFSATVFRNEVEHLIAFGAAGACASSYGCYQNVSEGLLQGLSLSANTALAGVRLSGSIDLQSPKDVTDTSGYAYYGKTLARRAKQHATLRADTDLAGWTLGSQLQLVGQRYDTLANTNKLGGYALLDLDGQYSLSRDLRLQLKLDNAFNREYQTARNYNSAPRQVFIGLRYTPDLF